MTSKSVVIHVGAAKCGSSALQTALSSSPSINRIDGSQVNYAAFDAQNSQILDKKKLNPTRQISGYRASADALSLRSADLNKIKNEISKYPTDLVFSREAWFLQSSHWEKLLEELDLNVHVVVYVRPKVQVLNSAWWQWGAWSDQKFEDWLEKVLKGFSFGDLVRRWSEIERVTSLTVRPVKGDIVADFYNHVLKAPKPIEGIRANVSLPGPMLRLFQRNRSLRPGPHNSGIDFALSSLIDMEETTPWIMDKSSIERILKKGQKDNELLMSFMDEPSAQAIRDDPRWWSALAYEDKIAESPYEQQIPPEKLEEMCVKMADALHMLKRENLKKKRA